MMLAVVLAAVFAFVIGNPAAPAATLRAEED